VVKRGGLTHLTCEIVGATLSDGSHITHCCCIISDISHQTSLAVCEQLSQWTTRQ